MWYDRIVSELQRVVDRLDIVIEQGVRTMAVLDILVAQIDASVLVQEAAVEAFKKAVVDAVSPTDVQALADKLKASSDALAAVVPAP